MDNNELRVLNKLYDELYQTWKREKSEGHLQKIRGDFYRDLAKYFRYLKNTQKMMDERTLKAKLIGEEYERARGLLKLLLAMRFAKLSKALLSNTQIFQGRLTEEEEHILHDLRHVIELHARLEKHVLEGRDLAAANFSSLEMPKRILVRFSCEVPAIVGVDMKSYGPFKPEDLVVLPRNNAETLIRRGVATAVELTESEDA